MLALRRSLDADAHRPVRIFRLLLPSVWAQHGAEALVDAFKELSGAFRSSRKPLTSVLPTNVCDAGRGWSSAVEMLCDARRGI